MKQFREFENIIDDPEDPRKYLQKFGRFLEDMKPSDMEGCKDLLLVLKKILDAKLAGGSL
jgi:hypothetical protein